MSVLDRLSAVPGVYWGEGRGPGGGRFVARIALCHQDDTSLTFDYEAWSPDGGLQHAESARMARTGASVTLAATSSGGDDTMIFREGEPGVFGSIGRQRVGLVITTEGQKLTFSWWWTGRDGKLREQSRAVVAPVRQIVTAPPVPGATPPAGAPSPQTSLTPPASTPPASTPPASTPPASTPGGSSRPTPAAPNEPPQPARSGQGTTAVTGSGSNGGPAPAQTVTPTLTPGTSSDPADPGVTVVLPTHGAPHPASGPATRTHAAPTEREDQAAEAARAAVSRHPAGRRRAAEPPPTGVTRDASVEAVQPEQQPTAAPGPLTVPWPGILVLHGPGTGLVAQRLAARLTRAAVVRTDLFDRAVRGTAGRPDPELRQRIAVSVVQGYAATGHPVILHGASSRREHEDLVAAIAETGLTPVKLVDVADGEDYGEVARRLIDTD